MRADIFGEPLIDGVAPADHPCQPNVSRGIRARVLITVPVLTLLGRSADGTRVEATRVEATRVEATRVDGTRFDGLDPEPAMLEGYGPIDIETARMLTADAPGFTRILPHPETGAVLSLGRDRYAIPPDPRAWLRMRDEVCRAPRCGSPARGCDLDHTQDWQHGGRSDHSNLAHLCPKHHDQKRYTRWRVEHIGEGDPEWTSPMAVATSRSRSPISVDRSGRAPTDRSGLPGDRIEIHIGSR